MQTLHPNSLLQGGRYKIVETLGQGGFGITYLAIQSSLDRKVAVKEFFMKDFCERDERNCHVTLGTEGGREIVNRFREKFLKEARNISKLNHPNIVRVIDVFEENGTAYYVMEYVENGSLAEKVKREGFISESVATRYILQVAVALDYIHQRKMNHLDVKPANIMLNDDDEVVLIDFGLSKQYDIATGGQTSTTPVGVSEGYAPLEQYRQGGVSEFSPETDIYALGATFFKLLTGKTPPSASDVNEDGVPVQELNAKSVSKSTIDVICKAMEGRKKVRMKNVHEFVDGLNRQNISEPRVLALQTEDDEATRLILEMPHIDYASHATPTSFANGRLEVKGVTYDMIEVQSGVFTMGATFEDENPGEDEYPKHKVTINHNYLLGKKLVTQALWRAVMGSNPSFFKGDNKPVENVSWDDCNEFISKLNYMTGKKFRLPTEAEWEFAARGGGKKRFSVYSVNNRLEDRAWFAVNSGNQTSNVATKRPNELEIYDMFGNVWEWCSDWYGKYSSNDQNNPIGPCSGFEHVIRGGSWLSNAWSCRPSCRNSRTSDSRFSYLGFRLALSVNISY